jgi:hypothetical protein
MRSALCDRSIALLSGCAQFSEPLYHRWNGAFGHGTKAQDKPTIADVLQIVSGQGPNLHALLDNKVQTAQGLRGRKPRQMLFASASYDFEAPRIDAPNDARVHGEFMGLHELGERILNLHGGRRRTTTQERVQ